MYAHGGCWKPIQEKAIARYPHIQANKNFKRGCLQCRDRNHLAMYAYHHSNVPRCPRTVRALEFYRFASDYHAHTQKNLVQAFV